MVDGEVVSASHEEEDCKHHFIIERKDGGGTVRAGDVVYIKATTEKYVDVSSSGNVRARWNDKGNWQSLVIEKACAGLKPKPWSLTLSRDNGWQVLQEQRMPWKLHVLPSLAPSPQQELTVIFFHALNSHHGFETNEDAAWLKLDGDVCVRLVCPLAPKRRLTNGWGYYFDVNGEVHAWHDMNDLMSVWIDLVDASSLREAREHLHSLVNIEAARLGGRYDRIVLAGHSHGACFALDGFLSSEKVLAGALIASGHVLTAPHLPPSVDPLAKSEAELPNRNTPIYMINGRDDDVFPAAMLQKGVIRLRSAGYQAVNRRIAAGGHEIDEDMYSKWWASALRKVAARRS
eukprot:TRINITY_DN16946_c0_g1_i2.p2 TRINITY_DN16946_c0_g1~~TRINITY_DN16946_c0_g1_i2.p2  ORF type:complete len:346 (-),score=41.31 TRINITY_DN16946_c0_g1_i2:203-1240(-)